MNKKFKALAHKQEKKEYRILRETINIHHLNSFIKPKNENCERRLPGCIVIGVYKCGTNEIIDFLKLHPHVEIFPTNIKKNGYEMPYFRQHSSLHKKGNDWLKSQMPCSYSNQITVLKMRDIFTMQPFQQGLSTSTKV